MPVVILLCLTLARGLAFQGAELHRQLKVTPVVAPLEEHEPDVFNPGFDEEPSFAHSSEIHDGLKHVISLTQELLGNKNIGNLPAFLSLPFVLIAALISFFVGGLLAPHIPKSITNYFVCVIYIAFSVAIDLSIAVQRNHSGPTKHHSYDFNPACSVLISEVVKFTISMTLCLITMWKCDNSNTTSRLTFNDIKWLSVPAMVFTVNNILVFTAIGKNDVATFGVFRDTMILWTAIMWKCVFKVPLGFIRLVGIVVIFNGLVINQWSTTGRKGAWSWAFLWVLLMTLCNAFGSVVNEYALKLSKELDINIQNMVLYTGTIVCTLTFIFATDRERILGGPQAFMRGFDSKTWFTVGLQSITGLLVSRILKNTDAVMKTVATCLRGPLLVFIAPIFTKSSFTVLIVVSSSVVASGCIAYLTQGPLKSVSDLKEEQSKKTENLSREIKTDKT